jgi:glyoxylase-like metal-dependent hydrolase (beta-lactamase superfamily II)
MKDNSMKKKILAGVCIILLVILIAAIVLYYPAIRFITQKEIVEIDPGLTLDLGGGGNSGIIIGDSIVIIIDTKMMDNSEELYKLAIEKAGQKPVRVINTHYHPDHVKGNKFFGMGRIYIGNYEKDFLQKNLDAENMPTDYVKDSLLFDLGNEKAHLYNLGQAHTMNDLIIYLEKRNLLFSGDLIFNRLNPVLMKESGANVSRWITVLDLILHRWGESKIVPGHGKIGDKEMAITMRQYFVDMTTAAADPSKENQLMDTYKEWMRIPNMSSPEATIEYIRMYERKKIL